MRPAKPRANKPGLSRSLSQASEQEAFAWGETETRLRNIAENNPHPEKSFFPSPHLATDSSQVSLRVLVVDDQLLVRAGLCALVRALPNAEIIGEAGDGREALRLIRRHNPDIVLMDIAMPGMNGLEALVLTKTQYPRVKVIILSEHPNEELVFRALRAGADGFVVKDDPVGELYTAIKAVAGGGEHLSLQLIRKGAFGVAQSQPALEEPAKHLTPRQQVVLRHMAEGRSTKEIASLLGVSVNTVKTHRLKLMEKLDVHEISAVVRYAAKLGLINN